MKKLIILILLIIGVFFYFNSNKVKIEADGSYDNKKAGYFIKFPKGWYAVPEKEFGNPNTYNATDVIVVSDSNKANMIQVVTQKVPATTTFANYTSDVKMRTKNLGKIEKEGKTYIDQNEAYWAKFTIMGINFVSYHVLVNNKTYAIGCFGKKEIVYPQCEYVINTMKFYK